LINLFFFLRAIPEKNAKEKMAIRSVLHIFMDLL